MSKSEELKKAAMEADSDFRVMSLMKKSRREKKYEESADFIRQFERKYRVVVDDNFKYSIETDKYGIIDWFPKADKLLIRKQNWWINFGRDWLKKNL